MTTFRISLLAIASSSILAAITVSPAHAQASAASATQSKGTSTATASAGSTQVGDPSALIVRLTRGMTDVKTFIEPTGLIGVVAKAKGKDGVERPVMLHVDPSGREVIYGLAFDLQKNVLIGAEAVKATFGPVAATTPQHLPDAVTGGNQGASTDELEKLARSAYIETHGIGTGGPTVYAFVEPNCGWCARAVPAMLSSQRTPGTPLANATIRWIPLYFTQDAAREDSIALGSSGDGRVRLSKLFSPTANDGTPSDGELKLVQKNVELFQALGDNGTPTFYVQRAGASDARRIEGWAGIEGFAE
ncbi:disulfide bond formation protein DsbG [Burkholderia gladioli]|uniref:Disulfide bond formation protein DsbG n=1 Tax=Burkholderia gladioli TaxID=28095 RepID=A0A2A7S9U3_BURGA|nr:disulfide bond formation protein DsbG [Burkholderia gladioli]PEH40427.1 disulfide bond formation protein DsbG [Burkholderia gladioli]